MNTAIEEKRRHRRIGEELNFALNVVSDERHAPQKSTFFHVTEDISESGLRFIASENIPPNSLLKIQLALETSLKTVTHFGRVRWIKKGISDRFFNVGMEVNHIGVEFTDSPPNDLQIWRTYIGQKLAGMS